MGFPPGRAFSRDVVPVGYLPLEDRQASKMAIHRRRRTHRNF